ncbi:MAG: hypothetical protein ACI9LM_000787 [Alteromonadaceae bacterium]|jgi:hypothetical protein
MKSFILLLLSSLSLINTAQAAEIKCTGAFIDTIAVEGRRSDNPSLTNSLLISFKDAQGNLHTCGGALRRYVYLKAGGNEAVFNSMMSLAFMAKANNYAVHYMINSGARIFTADELAYIQIVEGSPIF